MKILASAGAVLALAAAVQAAPLKIGSTAPNFSGLECTDGKTCSIDDMKAKDVLVVAITTNHCPVAIAYEDRIVEFAKKYCTGDDAKVALIAINVNNGPPDRMDKMKERAKEKGFNFPYAYDPSQKIAVELGATVTPEFFVFNKERKLVYHGAFDDSMKLDKVTEQYLIPAVEATLKGETVAKTTSRPVGCGIQYEKSR
jgi:peroxiredoxin